MNRITEMIKNFLSKANSALNKTYDKWIYSKCYSEQEYACKAAFGNCSGCKGKNHDCPYNFKALEQQETQGYIFEKLICENHNGKPYYHIQYLNEKGERHIGYSSYKLDCISEFLREYFIK